ncbi:MAG: PfkB family carbohydrate kinase [Rhizobiaceae bacterium]
MTGRLIQLSSVVVDHIYQIESIPAPGEEAVVHDDTLTAGGAFNAMAAARRCDMDVAYAGMLGTGPFADLVADALERADIEVLRQRHKSRDQGCCTVLIDRDGERSFITSTDLDGPVTTADLAGLPIEDRDWLLLSGYTLAYSQSSAAMTAWLETTTASRLVFDPSPMVDRIAPQSLAAARTASLWITTNKREAMIMTGAERAEDAAQALAADCPPQGGAVVRDGGNGCLIAEKNGGVTHIPAHEVTPIDTNGAGDAHVGAFIAMLARGEGPVTAAHIANVCAALSTTRRGPSTAPRLEETLLAMETSQSHAIRQNEIQY